jgi:hypothetical protein
MVPQALQRQDVTVLRSGKRPTGTGGRRSQGHDVSSQPTPRSDWGTLYRSPVQPILGEDTRGAKDTQRYNLRLPWVITLGSRTI